MIPSPLFPGGGLRASGAQAPHDVAGSDACVPPWRSFTASFTGPWGDLCADGATERKHPRSLRIAREGDNQREGKTALKGDDARRREVPGTGAKGRKNGQGRSVSESNHTHGRSE
jgi:hypothetical protein